MIALWLSDMDPAIAPVTISLSVMVGVFTACWMVVGIGAFARKLWSIRAGFVLSSVALAMAVLSWFVLAKTPHASGSPSVLGIIFQFAVVRQGRRVLRWHRELGAQSPLT